MRYKAMLLFRRTCVYYEISSGPCVIAVVNYMCGGFRVCDRDGAESWSKALRKELVRSNSGTVRLSSFKVDCC
jgi:hypothetical protein